MEDIELTGDDKDLVLKWYGEYAEVENSPPKEISRTSHRNAEGYLETTTVADTTTKDIAFNELRKKLVEKFSGIKFNTLHINTDFFPMRVFLQYHDDVPVDGFKIWQW